MQSINLRILCNKGINYKVLNKTIKRLKNQIKINMKFPNNVWRMGNNMSKYKNNCFS